MATWISFRSIGVVTRSWTPGSVGGASTCSPDSCTVTSRLSAAGVKPLAHVHDLLEVVLRAQAEGDRDVAEREVQVEQEGGVALDGQPDADVDRKGGLSCAALR